MHSKFDINDSDMPLDRSTEIINQLACCWSLGGINPDLNTVRYASFLQYDSSSKSDKEHNLTVYFAFLHFTETVDTDLPLYTVNIKSLPIHFLYTKSGASTESNTYHCL